MNNEEIENYILKAENHFEEWEFIKARDVLYEILEIDPICGRAHSYLGWYFLTQRSNYQRAEAHYKVALKYDPEFAPSYFGYANLLFQTSRYNDLEQFAQNSINVATVCNSSLYAEIGRAREMKGEFNEAVQAYKQGIRFCTDSEQLNTLNSSIERAQQKVGMFDGWNTNVSR